ncbi:MAG: hypothetical protein HW412_1817 [Bacteroidetes bacterium]|nr:hypothetical protein [Bacteroidota bacterium]
MEIEEFERVAQEVYDALPDGFKTKIENLRIIIEDLPDETVLTKTGVKSPYHLLGLYQGIPLNYRNTGYGTFPVVPDTITLYKRNIESAASHGPALREKIREVLVHEIAHYFGMTEEEIRQAGY